jgi:hypothetical protein
MKRAFAEPASADTMTNGAQPIWEAGRTGRGVHLVDAPGSVALVAACGTCTGASTIASRTGGSSGAASAGSGWTGALGRGAGGGTNCTGRPHPEQRSQAPAATPFASKAVPHPGHFWVGTATFSVSKVESHEAQKKSERILC